jgi:signal transduction histidine kinase
MLVPFGLHGDTGYDVKIRLHALRRALRNVIENAVRYGETADVTHELTDDAVVITIDDVGPGIPVADLEKVFDPFYRLEESRSLETGGHGLGLSIACTIVRAQGGEIALSNRSPKGLRVTVHLPISE